LKTGFLTQKF